MRNIYKSLIGEPELRRPFRSSKRIWEGDIKMGLEELAWEDVDWIHVARNRE
jgi:hypothetical protein